MLLLLVGSAFTRKFVNGVCIHILYEDYANFFRFFFILHIFFVLYNLRKSFRVLFRYLVFYFMF